MKLNLLKIKNDKDLEDLINYGFEKKENGNFYIKTVYSNSISLRSIVSVTYHINIETRFIEIVSSNIDYIMDDTLYNLIKNDMVEILKTELFIMEEEKNNESNDQSTNE